MKRFRKVSAGVHTHSFDEKLKVEQQSMYGLENNQKAMMLIDPEDYESGFTHSDRIPKVKVKRVSASLHDMELRDRGETHSDDEDPTMGYLEKEMGMPVINNASIEDEFENDLTFENDYAHEEDTHDLGANTVDSEFGDMTIESEMMDEFLPMDETIESDLEQNPVENEIPPMGEEEPMEVESTDDVCLVDADMVPDQDDETPMQFATIANTIHVIRANRIIATMTAGSAKRIGMDDVYLSDQFQDVVTATIQERGLRKGLIQSGFRLAKVKLGSSKITARVVEAKVKASLTKKLEVIAKKDRVLEQSLAIAAVGINRQFFKDAKNDLRANLETELLHAGVKGAARIIRAAFAQYGVSYAHSILALANKISDMPDVVRNQYASALDMTEDGDFESEDEEIESNMDEQEDEFEPIPASVTAAIQNPIRRNHGLLLAGVKSSAAMEILSGSASLV